MSGTRSSIRCIRCVVGFLLVACLVAGLSLPALAQTAAPNSPQLSEEQKARLRQAAGDPRLEPWQRDYMQQLAGSGIAREADGEWKKLDLRCGRSHHSAVYDPVRQAMVVFGGYFSRNDTWAFWLRPMSRWQDLEPSETPPSGRYGHSEIYDPVRDRVVIFGGWDGSYRDDTWALSLGYMPTWSELIPSGVRPSARCDPVAIYDPVRDRMVIFGGSNGSGLNDTWALTFADSAAWSELTPSGTLPSGRSAHTGIYDPVRQRLVVFGGWDGSYCQDTWAMSLGESPVWSEMTPSGTLPSGRSAHTAVYDVLRDRMVVFGGWDGSCRNDTWALSLAGGASWREIVAPLGAPPSGRRCHTAVYDPVADRMVVFGGDDGSLVSRSDTWALSFGAIPAWSELDDSGTLFTGRYAHTAIYDPVRDRMVIFGGYDIWNPHRNDTWVLSLTGTPAWNELVPLGTPPSPRWFHTAIYDPVRDRMVVFGGEEEGHHHRNDTWSLSFTGTPTWTELAPSGPPTPERSSHAAIYDPVRDRMIVYGGYHGSWPYPNDVWALSLGGEPAWSELTPSGTPPPCRRHHSAIYDPVRDRMVVFGGFCGGYPSANDTWELSLAGEPAWSQLVPAGSPPEGRYGHSAIYDPVRDRMVVYGGSAEWGQFADTWALSLAGAPAWSELAPAGTLPRGACYHSAGYDPLRDRMLIFGGACDYYGPLNETWGLQWTGATVPGPGSELPAQLALHAACPNPASGATLIRFEMPAAGAARLAIYDVIGRLVRRLVEGNVPAGAQQAEWDGRDEAGRDAAPGIYFARLEAGERSLSEKILILR